MMEPHRDDRRNLDESPFRGVLRPALSQQRTQLSHRRQVLGSHPAHQSRVPEHNSSCFGARSRHQLTSPSFPPSKPAPTSFANSKNSASEQPRLHQLNLRKPPCDQRHSVTSLALPGQPPHDQIISVAPTLETYRGESEETFLPGDPSETNMGAMDPESNSEYEEPVSRSSHPSVLTANFPIVRAKSNFIQSRALSVENNRQRIEGDSRENTATKRSVPSGESGSRKRPFISPSNCNIARTSAINGEATSVNALLDAVGKRNKNLEDDLNRLVGENENLRQSIIMRDKEMIGSRERLNKLTFKISVEKKNLDESFSEMKFQVKERLSIEKRQADISSQEMGALRIEIRESLEAVRNFHAKSDIRDDELLPRNNLGCGDLENSRKAVNLIKEVDEDRKKKQLVIDMLRKELEMKSGQVTEMSQRILELENLSGRQLINISLAEESCEEKSRNIQKTVDKRTELILNRLDEKEVFQEEKLHARMRLLDNQALAKDQAIVEMSKEFGISQSRLRETQNSLSIELQNKTEMEKESLKLSIDLSLVEKKRSQLEMMTSRLIKEKVNEQEVKSEINAENARLKNQNKTLSQDLEFHQTLLDEANNHVKSLKLNLEDRESIIKRLQECESANQLLKMELIASNENIQQREERNSILQVEKACMHLDASECHLKIKMLESEKENFIRISTQDSQALTHLSEENSQLKAQIHRLENTISSMKEENLIAQKNISLKEENLVRVSGCELKLEEKMRHLLETIENQECTSKDLRTRLACMQSKWEESRGREDLITGQVNVLRENLAEAKGNQISLNYEMEKLRGHVTDLSVKNSELEMIGESRRSRETIQRLQEQLNQEAHKHEGFDKILHERCENEAKINNMCEETKNLATLVTNLESDRDGLVKRLNTTQDELERSQKEVVDIKESHALQLSAAENVLQETEKQASESRKKAASAAREKAIATLEHKYELMLMNANNEKKRLTNRLSDSESRLLAMSAELAKLKGKPSLEETFSSSEHNEQTLRRPITERSETILGLMSSDLIEAERGKRKMRSEKDLCQDDAQMFNHGQHQKSTKITPQAQRSLKGVAPAKKGEEELQVVVPRSSERFSGPTTRTTTKPGIKKKITKKST